MRLYFEPYELQLKYPFRIADYTRTSTPLILTRIEHEGFTGYGEASMPPYLGENTETATRFLSKIRLDDFSEPDIAGIMASIDEIDSGNNAAKASIDIALHDLLGKMKNKACYELMGSDPSKMPATSITIGIDTEELIRKKLEECEKFNFIKVKLGSENDHAIIHTIRKFTQKPIYADANRGWGNKEHAIRMIEFLHEQNCLFVEQPLAVDREKDMIWLKSRSVLPLFADESCKRLKDMEGIKEQFHGINIKLMKSTGLLEAKKMIDLAGNSGLTVMIGCMSETSCGIMAAAAIAPFAKYADIDSPWMITNNPFKQPELSGGKIQLPDKPGLGITPETK